MGQQDVSRIRTYEENNTFISPALDGLISEIDSRLSGANCFSSITYTGELISKIEYYADQARTKKRSDVTFSRTIGSDGVNYITGIISIFYNEDGSEDSRVTTTLLRDVDDKITDCDNVFSTSEALC